MTYFDVQIRMHQNLKVKVLTALVLHLQRRLQAVLRQGHTVHQTKFIRPRLLELGTEHGVRQSEIQLDGIVTILPVPT